MHALETDLGGESSRQVAALVMEVVQGPNGHRFSSRNTIGKCKAFAGSEKSC